MDFRPMLRRLGSKLGPAPTTLPRVDERERLRTYPPPYPNTWYPLCESSEVAAGQVRFIQALGKKFVVFRTEQNTVGVLDAYCPHLGSNLAGGRVRGDCIECAFHHWKFQTDGRVREIPYATRVPEKLRARAWKVCEHHGFVTIWFGSGKPSFRLEPDEDIEQGALVYRGRHDAGVVRMHLCEFAENSVDHQHFKPIHGAMFVPWTRLKIPGIRVHYDASWERDENRQHIAYFRTDSILEVAGRRIERTKARAIITFYGPGSIVAFRIQIPDVGRITMFQTHLPEQPLAQRVRLRWFAEPRMPRALVSYVVGNWVSQWREDIAIWENKIFLDKPMLVADDGPVHRMRAWFRQFYEQPHPPP